MRDAQGVPWSRAHDPSELRPKLQVVTLNRLGTPPRSKTRLHHDQHRVRPAGEGRREDVRQVPRQVHLLRPRHRLLEAVQDHRVHRLLNRREPLQEAADVEPVMVEVDVVVFDVARVPVPASVLARADKNASGIFRF